MEQVVAFSHLKIRTIQSSAAIRRYIKHNLPSILYQWDDGGNDPTDLDQSLEKHYANSLIKRFMLRDEADQVKVVHI